VTGINGGIKKNVGTLPHNRAKVVIPNESPGFLGNSEAIEQSVMDMLILKKTMPIK
jgi:hypothetical protein